MNKRDFKFIFAPIGVAFGIIGDGSPLFESLRLVESAIFPLRKGG
ncbi:MAG: hypothetical protein V1749_01005 [Candidatus Desantisbacteria bacterium]